MVCHDPGAGREDVMNRPRRNVPQERHASRCETIRTLHGGARRGSAIDNAIVKVVQVGHRRRTPPVAMEAVSHSARRSAKRASSSRRCAALEPLIIHKTHSSVLGRGATIAALPGTQGITSTSSNDFEGARPRRTADGEPSV